MELETVVGKEEEPWRVSQRAEGISKRRPTREALRPHRRVFSTRHARRSRRSRSARRPCRRRGVTEADLPGRGDARHAVQPQPPGASCRRCSGRGKERGRRRRPWLLTRTRGEDDKVKRRPPGRPLGGAGSSDLQEQRQGSYSGSLCKTAEGSHRVKQAL